MLLVAPDPRLGIAPDRIARVRVHLDAAPSAPGLAVAIPGGPDGVLDALVLRPDGVLGLVPVRVSETAPARTGAGGAVGTLTGDARSDEDDASTELERLLGLVDPTPTAPRQVVPVSGSDERSGGTVAAAAAARLALTAAAGPSVLSASEVRRVFAALRLTDHVPGADALADAGFAAHAAGDPADPFDPASPADPVDPADPVEPVAGVRTPTRPAAPATPPAGTASTAPADAVLTSPSASTSSSASTTSSAPTSGAPAPSAPTPRTPTPATPAVATPAVATSALALDQRPPATPTTSPVPLLGRDHPSHPGPPRPPGARPGPASSADPFDSGPPVANGLLPGDRRRTPGLPAWMWTWRGLAVAAVAAFCVALGVALLVVRGATPSPASTPAADPTSTRVVDDTTYTRQAATVDTSCQGRAYGLAAQFLRERDCTRLDRSLWSGTGAGGRDVVAVAVVTMGDPSSASALKSLVDSSGTGNITDLLREGRTVPGAPSSIGDGGYGSAIDGTRVVIVESAWLDGRTGDRPGLDRLARAAVDAGLGRS